MFLSRPSATCICTRDNSPITHYLGNCDQPVPAVLDSLNSEVKLQGAGNQRTMVCSYSLSPSTKEVPGSIPGPCVCNALHTHFSPPSLPSFFIPSPHQLQTVLDYKSQLILRKAKKKNYMSQSSREIGKVTLNEFFFFFPEQTCQI